MSLLRLVVWSVVGAVMIVAGLAAGGYWVYRDARAPGPLAAARTLVIPAHTGVAGIADLLAGNGVVRHPLVFRVVARLSGYGSSLKAGEFEFPAAVSPLHALDIIASGKTVKHRLTIPEGLTSAAVVALVNAAPALRGKAGPPPPEGSLLPDTYIYSYGDSRKELIKRMQRAMARTVAKIWKKRRPGLPLADPAEAVTLASIIEKETGRPEERAHVAGVFINRLRHGMRLQADPTVLFALSGDGAHPVERKLTHADLAIDSPYNTYLVKGLPPGPIANPGRASLLAAVRPEPTDDLYFVADGSGGHRFAKTLAEQTRNIARYRRNSAAAADPAAPTAPAGATTTDPAASGGSPKQAARARH